MPSENEIVEQSKTAYNQWCKLWRKNAEIHSKREMHNLKELTNIGIGKAILVVANGYSFEQNIETIKSNKDNVDIMCCDKTLGSLLENGISPTYCLVCDASVDYKKYLEKYENILGDTILIMNACGNPEWSQNGNWKKQYFFVNRDVLKSEREFMELSGCPNSVPAGTNVSNAMVVMLTQCDEKGIKNHFGYDKMLLIGFDYSWQPNGKYYAFDDNADGKNNYMRHHYLRNYKNEMVYCSSNLLFSSRWLHKYITTFHIIAVQCSDVGIFNIPHRGSLKKHMQYKFKPSDQVLVDSIMKTRENLNRMLKEAANKLRVISHDHYLAVLDSM